MPQAHRLAGGSQRLVDSALMFRRHVDFVAELAGEGHAGHDRIRTRADGHLPAGEEGKGVAAHILVQGDGLQQLPRLWTGDVQAAIARREILDAN